MDHDFVFYSPDRDSSLAGKEYIVVMAAKAKALAGVAAEVKAARPAQVAMDGSSVGTSVDGALDGVNSDSGEANRMETGVGGEVSGGRRGMQVAVTVLKSAVNPCSALQS